LYTLGDTTNIARKVLGCEPCVRYSESQECPDQRPLVTLGAEQKKPPKDLFSQPEKGPDTTIVPLGVSSKALET